MIEFSSNEELINHADEFIHSGYSASQVLNQFFKVVLESDALTALMKSRIMEKVAEIEGKLIQGGRDDLMLYDLFITSKKIIADLRE